ncbi:lycopene cyclase family protein [Segetibacter koreensis]|uniref:lycopene cyclase family protein n=1 Tax=Segetibacter koreensis TaxID=398037 RepID=UPI00036EFC35|nr:lycopene cyclase family protein [Segetibacter koreensis]
MNDYDYIISGAGAAGLSLLMRLMQNEVFDNKKILVVDKAQKNENDHTWCYWEQQPGLFEPVVYHQWEQVIFYSKHYSSLLNLSPYSYKMIRSIDFYNYVLQEAEKHPNITFKYGRVEAAGNEGSKGLVVVDGVRYLADYVFNSILFAKPVVPANKHYLLQHFKGFTIETKDVAFNPSEATLMDFRVSQQHGTTFVYVLPVSRNRALVEYTLFTKELLPDDEYTSALHNYISSYLNIHDYVITEQEFGVIPMTDVTFVKQVGRVINIGTAGGQTKGSTGYTFQFVQKHSEKLVADLLKYGYPKNEESIREKRFKIYDSTLLHILSNNKLPGDKIFAALFKKNPVDRVLRFLDNETTLEDEINVMGTLPQVTFMKAALQALFK